MKVAIVNDSVMACEILRRIVNTVPGFTVSWIAKSGDEALQRAQEERPDIVLMDLVMPGKDGAQTTRALMQSSPCVVLIVTATTAGNRNMVFEAMSYGALDAVNTPQLGLSGELTGAEQMITKLKMVARLAAASPHRKPLEYAGPPSPVRQTGTNLTLVVIGASTGGPQAVAQILSQLPKGFPAAILIAQHVDKLFASGLASWLQQHTDLPVRLAKGGEALSPGTVWLAAGDDHMVYAPPSEGAPHGSIRYTSEPADTAYRPSVNALFYSLAGNFNSFRIGVLLTGMGRDGAAGLSALRETGAFTIAQDASTSIVFGMPKAAIEMRAPMEVLPLPVIGSRIRDLVFQNKTSASGAAL